MAKDYRSVLTADMPVPAPDPRVGVTWVATTLHDSHLGLSHDVVVCSWDFAVAGGSFGVRETDAFVAAAQHSLKHAVPLITLVRSGGTRLTEGVAALRGMARATLATEALSAAGIPHLSVADNPSCGGVWVTVVQRATLRAAVSGATVGFAGPRVVEAVTGKPVRESHTAESAASNGLVDALVLPEGVLPWLLDSLRALKPQTIPVVPIPAAPPAPTRQGWAQVQHVRERPRPGAQELLRSVIGEDGVPLAVARNALAASAVVSNGIVGVALGTWPGLRPSADAFRLVRCAADLADRLHLPLITVVDTPGAEPGSAAENDGIAIALCETFGSILSCSAPTLGILAGEGGSGGALSALVCDRVLATPSSYFAALVPEGAAVTLRQSVQAASEVMRVNPAESGVVDAFVDEGAGFAAAVRAHLGELCAIDPDVRLAARKARWA